MINWPNFVSQLFNGLALGALLALISSGLTIIYGTLGVLNLAHGAMFMIGGYAGYVTYSYTGSFILAVIAGSLFVMALGVAMERIIIRHFYHRPHEDQLLVTFGLGICFVEIVRLIFTSQSQVVPPPALLQGITSLGFLFYPTYRLAVVGIVAVALGALFLILYRTRLGMIVRAGIEDSVMVDSLGINVYRVFMIVFGIGAMAAGFAGIINAPGGVADAGCRRRHPGRDLRGGGDRRRRLVSRRHPRRTDRRRDHQHHLDVQPRLRLRHAVRGDDARAGAQTARPARHAGPRMTTDI
ncbi:branched-chain amino acid transport system permease protein [Bradyrhizobium elkanii]